MKASASSSQNGLLCSSRCSGELLEQPSTPLSGRLDRCSHEDDTPSSIECQSISPSWPWDGYPLASDYNSSNIAADVDMPTNRVPRTTAEPHGEDNQEWGCVKPRQNPKIAHHGVSRRPHPNRPVDLSRPCAADGPNWPVGLWSQTRRECQGN